MLKSAILTPRESGEHIVKNSTYVKVLPEGIKRLSKEIIEGIKTRRIDIPRFSQHELHPRPEDSNAAEWIFVVDTLNFCFWTSADETKYKVKGYTGYFALCAAINRAISEGVDMTDANVYSKMDLETLRNVFRSDDAKTEIPLIEERLDCLHEVGECLLEKWHGKFENVVRAANHSAARLLQLVIREFPCFRDEALFEGKHVSLYKRAQILIGDFWACFRGDGLGAFKDLDVITMFADYRVPQVLVHFGCLEYNDDLMDILRKDAVLVSGDSMEVEIRGASIYVVEQVKQLVRDALKERKDIPPSNINSIIIDHFLWDYRRQHADELNHIPFHKVLSIYY